MRIGLAILFVASLFVQRATAQSTKKPLRVGVVGLVHTHVHGILSKAFRRSGQTDIEIVGIAEPDRALAERYAKQYGFPLSLVYPSIDQMLDKAKPEAVTDFGRIVDHLKTVQICAPRGIHVMVEKPLSVSFDQAKQMEKLARKHSIQLLTNYETTWYGSNHKAYAMVNTEKAIGDLRKIVVHDGHQGPKEIGVTNEFLDWLTDPVANGAGALFDFGCYGANLSTWLMHNQRPLSVLAVTQQIKPDIYPKVDDEGTIILTYPKTQTIIQASWNWPFARKDMEVYGQTGYVFTVDGTRMRVRLNEDKSERAAEAALTDAPATDPFAYFARLIHGETKPDELTSLENNMIVMEILDAARQSAKTGKVVPLSQRPSVR
ncbi:Gfo/Idh/MocA family protein [Spirosoma utsteinense]|uniref:Dehydrogenase n=1 Tax=Spirosoma utsteinense TaxID=2585773 RepID=A0ABR6W605_9BACT|nr:Gfo/Idh/MocA family oxidoreductase [Spirosoma utsteinense]MBC3785844.1 putative dehydrogenase [Spirosoma utsteinense]MBC3792016.1 putative dehydrogenase [Spirosoma utsteinense]